METVSSTPQDRDAKCQTLIKSPHNLRVTITYDPFEAGLQKL